RRAGVSPRSLHDALPILRGASKSGEGRDADRAADSVEAQDMAYLEVVEESGELVRVLVNDAGGVGIEFRFASWQFNPKVEDSFLDRKSTRLNSSHQIISY